MTLYFAYGSNLNLNDLARWCQKKGFSPISSSSSRPALLPGFRLVFDYYSCSRMGGVADIEPSREDAVEGAVYETDATTMKIIDLKEGAPRVYKRIKVQVQLSDGAVLNEVTTYMVRKGKKSRSFIPPTKEYLNIIVEGAKKHGLSEKWIRRLMQIPTRK